MPSPLPRVVRRLWTNIPCRIPIPGKPCLLRLFRQGIRPKILYWRTIRDEKRPGERGRLCPRGCNAVPCANTISSRERERELPCVSMPFSLLLHQKSFNFRLTVLPEAL